MVCVAETDMCGVDAIQFLTGCTFGKGNLIHKDYGKMGFRFYDRKTGKGFRAVLAQDLHDTSDAPEMEKMRNLMQKKISGDADETELAELESLRSRVIGFYMDADLEKLFTLTWLDSPAPRHPRVLESLPCAACREMTMESRTRRIGGKYYCIPCFARVEQKV